MASDLTSDFDAFTAFVSEHLNGSADPTKPTTMLHNFGQKAIP